MAKVLYGGGVTAFRGSIGGITFQENKSGYIARARPLGHKSKTEKQSSSQNDFSGLIALWQKLSIANQTLWNDFATLHTKDNIFSETKTLTGANWFTTINFYRQLLNLATYNSPPAYVLPAAVAAWSLTVNDTKIQIDFDAPFNPADTSLLIKTTQAITRTETILRSELRLTDIEISPPYTSIDITSEWEATHGINYPPSSVMDKYSIMVAIQTIHNISGISQVGSFKIGSNIYLSDGIGDMIIENTFIVS